MSVVCGTAFVAMTMTLALGASGQVPTGSLCGKTADESGGILPGVTITATSTEQRRVTVSSASGQYRFDQLRLGTFRVEANLAGFVTAVADAVTVEAGKVAEWNATLKLRPRAVPDWVADLRAHAERITGPQPKDCGQHLIVRHGVTADPSELQPSLACALEAATQSKPFVTFKQHQGIDSSIATGLLGSPQGVMLRFSYDSDPSGGSGHASRFTTERCDKPAVVTGRDLGSAFHCQSAPAASARRYLVTAAPLDVGVTPQRLCLAVDPADRQGIWWWEPGNAGCANRSTGPDVFRAERAQVSSSAQALDCRFQLQLHSMTTPFVEVHFTVDGDTMRSVSSGATVAIQRRSDLNIPER
jgi:carboxypeptidase family protein